MHTENGNLGTVTINWICQDMVVHKVTVCQLSAKLNMSPDNWISPVCRMWRGISCAHVFRIYPTVMLCAIWHLSVCNRTLYDSCWHIALCNLTLFDICSLISVCNLFLTTVHLSQFAISFWQLFIYLCLQSNYFWQLLTYLGLQSNTVWQLFTYLCLQSNTVWQLFTYLCFQSNCLTAVDKWCNYFTSNVSIHWLALDLDWCD